MFSLCHFHAIILINKWVMPFDAVDHSVYLTLCRALVEIFLFKISVLVLGCKSKTKKLLYTVPQPSRVK